MLLTLRRVWSTLAGQRGRYAAAVAALVLASCCLYLAPLIPQAVIDGVLVPDQTAAPSRATRFVVDALGGAEYLAGHLTWPACLFLGISALAGLFTYLRARWAAEASQAIVRGLRDRLYDHLQHLPCRYFDHAETGDLIQRCSADVETLRKFLASQVVEIGRALIMLGIPIPLMLAIDARMTGVSLLLLPAISAFSFFTFRRIKVAFTATDEADGALTARITENLNGIRVVRAFARQDHELTLFEARNREHRDRDYALYAILARFWALSDLMCFVQKGLVVGAGAWWIAQGSLAVGAFFYFLTAVNLFLWPVRQMGRILADLGKAVVALERIDEILHEPAEADPVAPAPAERLAGDVEFAGVSFAHGEHSVLRDIDFTLPAGQTLAILGASGSGKTTLVNLLLRLYDYEQGSIRLGGRELRELPRKQVRAHVAVVMQQPFLFSKDLASNVRLGRSAASHGEVVEAATSACVHRTIEGFDQGYATVVGERGVTLSGGQRQRVALARALIQRPALLILDDALSAVDTDTEASILQGIRAARTRQSTILIAHRVSTVQDADQILVLDQGRVAERGDHESLLAQGGIYARLYRAQTALEATDEQTQPRPEPEAKAAAQSRRQRASTAAVERAAS